METKAQEAEARVDKSATKEEALKNAISAAELYIKATSQAGSDHDKARLREKCKQLLSRAEEIKQSPSWTPKISKEIYLEAPASERAISRQEEIILLEGSKLHGFIFPRWTSEPRDSVFEETSEGSSFYVDPTDLKLSDAQAESFAGWKRPHEYFDRLQGPEQNGPGDDDLSMIAVNEIDLVQDITTDCSVVASLCAGTARAQKGHGKLLPSIIYPFDKAKSRLRVSKNGKYIFRLHFNGCFRRVTIDDRLPASNTSRSLHVVDRNNPHLIWPALVEKAYLKVRGGYDFPGCNSATDLWVLTGWIPEQVFLQSDDLQPQQLWSRIFKSFGYGDVLITLGTGKLTQKEEKELGLVGEHDYAILDMKEIRSQRLLLVKNPWCDGLVWKGSRLLPEESWTQDLRDSLPNKPPGTFWMSFQDVAQNFESLYLNWNPGLFRHRQDHHFSWAIPQIRNPGLFSHNPQYSLKSSSKGTVWVLLSRHFATAEHDIVKTHSKTSSESASSALGFISLYLFEANGHRVYLSDDAFHRGAYVDSPQTLACIEVAPSITYTIVIAQHGLPLPKYSFTLSLFSLSPLTCNTAIDTLSQYTNHSGSWTRYTSGGNASASTYPLNPQYSITVPKPGSDLILVLEADNPELAVHVKVVWAGGSRVTAVTSKDILGGSGDYRRGCALTSLSKVTAGKYTIVCSTFEAGQTGNFTLRVGSEVPCSVVPIPSESAGRLSLRLPALMFHVGIDRMLGPLTISRLTRLRIIARSLSTRSRPLLKLSVERGQGPNKVVLAVSGNGEGEFSDALTGIRTGDLDLSPETGRQGGLWIVVERLGGRIEIDDVEVEVLSESPVQVGVWGTGNG